MIRAESQPLVQDWSAGEVSAPSVSVSGAAAHGVANVGESVSVKSPTLFGNTVEASIV